MRMIGTAKLWNGLYTMVAATMRVLDCSSNQFGSVNTLSYTDTLL